MPDTVREPLDLFYEEPDVDRWIALDRYPRKVIRRIVRGPAQVGGQRRVFMNLCAGLDRIGVRYRVNQYRDAVRNPDRLVCILGKAGVLSKIRWCNPMVVGPAMLSHPLECPTLYASLDVRLILVPGEWMRQMCLPYWGERVVAWPVGIDTDAWRPPRSEEREIDVLIYDKIRWSDDRDASIRSIVAHAKACGLRVALIRYGAYQHEEFRRVLHRSRCMIFVCEHETQGLAYQEALSSGVPVLAWDSQGPWRDPAFFPDLVRFEPTSSVPYWDDRCGMKFRDMDEFTDRFMEFWTFVQQGFYRPREYIVESLSLETCARRYVELVTTARTRVTPTCR